MTTPAWFILHVDGAHDRLLRCTNKGYDTVNLRISLEEPPSLDDLQASDISDRFAPDGEQRHADGHTPEATHTANDMATEGDLTERYLRMLGDSVQDLIGDNDAPVHLAMPEGRATMFEMVGGVEVAGVLTPHARAADLWQESRLLQAD
jgi:hypothetical protein